MLNSDERRALAGLEATVLHDDRRFADGLRDGRPKAPREFRWRLRAVALVLSVLALASGCWAALAAGAAWALWLWPIPVAGIAWAGQDWRRRRVQRRIRARARRG